MNRMTPVIINYLVVNQNHDFLYIFKMTIQFGNTKELHEMTVHAVPDTSCELGFISTQIH